jgi:16S rRNA (cytidine1402-2'-O)-methyltransferase
VGRELTKIHEELVRGPISAVLKHLGDPRGEFTVVANLVNRANSARHNAGSDVDLTAEFSRLTESGDFTRRQAVSALAKRFGLPARDVYQRLEQAKKARPT